MANWLRLLGCLAVVSLLGCGTAPSAPGASGNGSDTSTSNRTQLDIRQLKTLDGQSGSIASLTFTTDSRYLACGGQKKAAAVWDVRSLTLLQEPEDFADTFDPKYVTFKPHSLDLIDASGSRVIQWKHQDDRWVGPSKNDLAQRWRLGWIARSAAFAPDGKLLVIGERPTDAYTILGEVPTTLSMIRSDGNPAELNSALKEDLDLDEVSSVAFSPDGRTLAAGGQEYKYGRSGCVRLIDTDRLDVRAKVVIADGPVRCVAFAPEGATLAVGIKRRTDFVDPSQPAPTVFFIDINIGLQQRALPEYFGTINSLSYSPDGKLLATAGADGHVRLREASSNRELFSQLVHHGPANVVAFSRDGRLLASGGADGIISLWKVEWR